ncbi:MAG TPA: helix-turn-helix transcriptional regulator [Polyangiaceae bacterium]|nr:helix-turn-helix transcriptional regulator [Polyangiaceae bacterium]
MLAETVSSSLTPVATSPRVLTEDDSGLTSHEREVVRAAAVAAIDISTTRADFRAMWRELTQGRLRVLDAYFHGDQCYLLLLPQAHQGGSTLSGRRLEIVESVLRGTRQKAIAIDLAVTPSTVALESRQALKSLGTDTKPSRVHPLLMLAVRAAEEPTRVVARSATLAVRDLEVHVMATRRPEGSLVGRMPGAELEVIRGLVEGLSYDELARRRGTSRRTVANQISAAFRRLHVSGRNELVQVLFNGDVAQGELPKVERPSLREELRRALRRQRRVAAEA